MSIITALVITLCFVLRGSSAQPQAQPSPQCIAAYNATFNEEDTTGCVGATFALFLGAATDEQRMMVCSSGQQCNTMIENIISVCGDTIDNPTRLTQDLVCTTGPNDTSCLTTFLGAFPDDDDDDDDDDDSDIIGQLGVECTGSCSQICMQALMQLNDSLGCCFVELLQGLIDSGAMTSTQASLFANGYPEQCGLGVFTSCSGSVIPADPCSNASISLFGGNDECSMSVRGLFFEDNELAIINLYNGDCPTRFYEYATACSGLFGDSSNEILQLATGIRTISQATASNGRRCTDLLPVFLSEQNTEEADCTADYFLNRCSSGCRDLLINVTAEYGCCLNTVFSELIGRSDEVDAQIEYPIISREIYSLCEIPSPGFCTETNPPYTTAAERCISARNSFFADSTCLDYYLTLGERPSATAVNSAGFAICASQRCKNRMSSYNDLLITCRLENIVNDDDDDDDDDDDMEDIEYLELAYLTGNTTCRVGRSNTTCYSSIYFNQQYGLVSAAFDDENPNPVCALAVTGPCSAQCTQVLTTAYSSVGCCLGEYGRALLGADNLTAVATNCGIPSINDRCTEIAAIQDAGGANTQRGLGITVISLLGVIAIMLS